MEVQKVEGCADEQTVEGNVDVPTAEGRVEVQTVEGNVEMWSVEAEGRVCGRLSNATTHKRTMLTNSDSSQ